MDNTPTWVAPIIAGVFLLASGLIAGVFLLRGKRSDHAPDVTDSWREAERSRRLSFAALDLFYALRTAFRSYVLRVQAGGSIELTASESGAFALEPPSMDAQETKVK